MDQPHEQPGSSLTASHLERYSRQMRFAPLGEQGQNALSRSCALVAGCGALGSASAELLVRAGVGKVRVVDRDYLELHNLQRQSLYDESDVASGLPKAVIAQRKLQAINSQVQVEAFVADINHRNMALLCEGAHVIVDGLDNFETRFLLNDASHKFTIPWIYGGCLGAEGQVLAIVPGKTPGLHALVADVPPPGATPTCDMAGVLGPIVQIVAALQSMEALKILSGSVEAVNPFLTVVDIWSNRIRQIDVRGLPIGCDDSFPWLAGQKGGEAAVLCGRNAVQLASQGAPIDLDSLAENLRAQGLGDVRVNRFLLRYTVDSFTFTVFTDGRVVVVGTDEPAKAKTATARYLGR